MTGERRILMYSQDGFGLGHFRRATNIAREILAREPESRILILADSPAPPFLAVAGVDYVKLPTVVKAGSSTWHAGSLGIQIRDAIDLRAQAILAIYRAFRPEVVLVDHMPVGALGELKPTLDCAINSAARPRLFLGLRDVLDAPEVIRSHWWDLGAYDYLSYYDAVLVYGCREIYDAESAYGLSSHSRSVVYCNYVSRGSLAGMAHAEQPREAPLVLMMGGGVHDAFPLAWAFVRAFASVLSDVPLRAVVVTGPNMPAREHEAVARKATSQIRVERSLGDSAAWIGRASAVVTMGGYNSLCEVLARQKKTLVVPRSGPSLEQRIRSGLFADRGLLRMLELCDASPKRLARDLSRLLAATGLPDPANIPPMDGAGRAAAMILGEELVDSAPVAGESLSRGETRPRSLAPVAAASAPPAAGQVALHVSGRHSRSALGSAGS